MNPLKEQPNFIDNPFVRRHDMERLSDIAKQIERMYVGGVLQSDSAAGSGLQVAIMPDTGLWAKITDQNPDDTDPNPPRFFYSFVEMEPTGNEVAEDGVQWTVRASGGVEGEWDGVLPAREVQGRTDVPAGTIVRLWLADSGDHYQFRYDGPGTDVPRGVVGEDIADRFDDAVAQCSCDEGAPVNEHWICFQVTYEDFASINAASGNLTLFTVGAGRKFDVISYTFRGIKHFQLPFYLTGTSTIPNGIAYDEVTFSSTELGATSLQSLGYNDDLVANYGTHGGSIYSMDGDDPAYDAVTLTATIDPGGHGQLLSDLLCGEFEICVLLRDISGDEPAGLDEDGNEDENIPAGQQKGILTANLTTPTYEYSDQVEPSYAGLGGWGWGFTGASVYVETLSPGLIMSATHFDILFKGFDFSLLPDCSTITKLTINYEIRQSATTGDSTTVEVPPEISVAIWGDNSNPGFPDMPNLGWFLINDTTGSLTSVNTGWVAVSRSYTSLGNISGVTTVEGPHGDILKDPDFGVKLSALIKAGDSVGLAYTNVEFRNIQVVVEYYAPVES